MGQKQPLSCRRDQKTGELGFLGLYTNPDYDGLGLPRLDAAIVFEELAWGDTAVAAYISIHNMVTWMIGEYAKDDVRADLVPRLVSGELLSSYCLTEPNAGSDAGSLTTKAVKQDGEDYYLLSGEKPLSQGQAQPIF
nr:acyl-CoA dehydrogenase family protein [Psychrobacter sp. PraFG1]UNK05662.1 acyl-CoA dehydrogenase family protein [Psychrobacter sp. PraFG1]